MPAEAPSRPNAVEAEVFENILNDRAGPVTVASLGLDPAFVRRVADHVITESYVSRYRVVVPDGTPWPPAPAPATAANSAPASAPAWMTIHPPPREEWLADDAKLGTLPEAVPAMRGYRASYEGEAARDPFGETSDVITDAGELARLRILVGERLATDGLLLTTFKVLKALPASIDTNEKKVAALWEVGIPVDLLGFFRTVGETDGDRATAHERAVRTIAEKVSAIDADEFRRRCNSWIRFELTQGLRTRGAPQRALERPIREVRVQLPRGDYWLGAGAGGAVDVVRQLMEAGVAPRVVATVHERHIDALRASASGWRVPKGTRLEVLATTCDLDQWTRDSGLAAWGVREGAPMWGTLAPRYPSRSEHASKFVGADLAGLRRLAASGHPVARSPLLFQGGNVFVCRDIPGGQHELLLIGEAEIYRNRALGLNDGETLQLLSLQFGSSYHLIFPAVGFHLDMELSIRSTEQGGAFALINDPIAGALLVIRAALPALRGAGLLEAVEVEAVAKALDANDRQTILGTLLPRVQAAQVAPGQWPLRLTMPFAVSPVDSPVGNFQRFLYAMDLLLAEALDLESLAGDPFTQAYYGALRRRAAARATFQPMLEQYKFQICPVPGWAEARVGMAYVNALQTRDAVYLSTYGGLYASVDEAAIAAVQKAVGPKTRVIGILTGESQCRFGGVHCSTLEYSGD
ncbi:MAG: agmatine deiminase family protein [Phycisphaerae bacterium]|nr:agmatine deiminase family protein [Phycisphaerae bacterium]